MTEGDKTAYWLDLGLLAYKPAFKIQESVLQALMKGQLPATVIVQENSPVFTIGRAGSYSNLLTSPEELKRIGIEVLEVNRGGDITYHGPGQLIASPLFYLGDINLNANQYLHRLEDVLINLLLAFGIHTHKKEGYPGAWWKKAKIGAVGIAVKHGFTFHGLSLNVSLDLAPFNMINPCGIHAMPITSMSQILARDIPMIEIKEKLRKILAETFSVNFKKVRWQEIKENFDVTKDGNE